MLEVRALLVSGRREEQQCGVKQYRQHEDS
jgi:hypothetical protein